MDIYPALDSENQMEKLISWSEAKRESNWTDILQHPVNLQSRRYCDTFPIPDAAAPRMSAVSHSPNAITSLHNLLLLVYFRDGKAKPHSLFAGNYTFAIHQSSIIPRSFRALILHILDPNSPR